MDFILDVGFSLISWTFEKVDLLEGDKLSFLDERGDLGLYIIIKFNINFYRYNIKNIQLFRHFHPWPSNTRILR